VLVCAAVPVVIVELIKRFQVQAAVAQEVRS
jgi:hypothetical protein